MSEIKVDSLTGKTSAGNITVTSEGGAATMQLQQGLAKALSRSDNSATLSDSLNIASTVDVTIGQWRFNKTNVMTNANYEVVSSAGYSINSFTTGNTYNTPESSTAHTMSKYNQHAQAFEDFNGNGQGNVIVHGDLA